ncbi:MBL fold metallo-hydrolase [Streptomyces scabiei]|uniref:MBL fold metallo-hydrolase n=1 Tax=Streptomyces scabiei TaxID=1930 RepID=UPI00076603CD|nr:MULTISPECIES: MBL fold metallo-hydrolase [Streptomyces]MBP5894487.1 MBL fold metallo-hydrolase [Streptomyces sp. LBUM 1481]MBP5924755.1 MBL fold metallo-hydrolase [Streptomyces sp. LBUM 1483]MDX2533984.1 MBL fold metallo-hydrolase [Streptomyces scabiei]MDX2686429.1 MBL fold metallo-hydrolase [Streptomyces scabiei]MDX2751402.1 MBL fold metallo-hydrolase [Streptomyces scabiei]
MSLSLTVLGTASPYPRPGRPASGYLLRGGGAEIWVDAGFGTFAELQRHTDPTRLTAIWISHLHADHTSDLAAAAYGFAFGGLTLPAPLPVYAPDGCAERLAGFFGRPDTTFLKSVFDFRPLYDGHTVRHWNLTLTARAVVHDVEAYGLRAACQGRVFAYSGDTGPCEALSRLAGGADLFLCEADVDTHRDGEPRVHLTPEEAGTYAKSASRLLITHVGPTLTREGATGRAAVVFGGPTESAREGDTRTV